MAKFISVLKDSFRIFSANPKFILPKLLIAILYSYTILSTTGLFSEALSNPSPELLASALALLLFVIGISLLDIIVGAMYTPLVAQVKAKKEVSLSLALKEVIAKAGKILPAVIAVELGFIALITVLSLPLSFLFVTDDSYFLVFSVLYAAILIAAVFFFYQLYPILFEGGPVVGSLKKSIHSSLQNKGEVAKATFLSLALSVLSFALALAIEFMPQQEGTMLFWAAFGIIRLLTAYVYSYLYVLSPVFYSAYSKGK